MSDFDSRTEPFRKELLAHCYRMLASVHEAEDAVQETYLRAWRSWSGFEERSSVRVWMYRIATNVCLTALEQRGRRALPSGLGAPATDLSPGLPPHDPSVLFVEPIAESLVLDDPATIVATRESLRLALIAALQYLPAKQRAVLILREVLAFPAAEVATMLDTSVAAVKSTLQRARARLDENPTEAIVEPDDPRAQVVASQARLIEELLVDALPPRRLQRRILFHGHCHQKALAGTAATVALLRATGAEVVELDAGCCGMAGSFGFEAEHYELSLKIGEDRLFPAVRAEPPDTLIAATGVSCRQQIEHGTGRRAQHPVQLIYERVARSQAPTTRP